jgi:phenylpropionate dioxygenase-like ring-hydroxylating dioxygenase large terminal subunit
MKIQDSEVFKRFWYVTVPVDKVKEGPQAFRLFDEDIVIWQNAAGEISAMADHCCHRSARLSLGEVVGDRLACPYHGWEFSVSGQCELIPQMPDFTPPASSCVRKFRSEARYGYVWVALVDPLAGIPDLPEASAPGFRLIQEFHEVWDMSVFRLVDNWFDLAHVAFVHRGTQGDINKPIPPEDSLEETEFGLISRNLVPIANRSEGQQYTGINTDTTTRDRTATWFAPNSRRLAIGYPNGLKHIIFTSATPLAEGKIMFTQMCMRNDTEEDIPAATAVAFDRKVTAEDKLILESTLPDIPVLPGEPLEQAMRPDRAQMAARRKLREIVMKYDPRYASAELKAMAA